MHGFLTLNRDNLAKCCPISPSSTSFENYKARPTFLDNFWVPQLPNQTQNLTGKGVTLYCHNCILSEFTNMLPDNLRSSFWPNLLHLPSYIISMSGPSQFSNQYLTMIQIGFCLVMGSRIQCHVFIALWGCTQMILCWNIFLNISRWAWDLVTPSTHLLFSPSRFCVNKS